jgi:hypothetical protein
MSWRDYGWRLEPFALRLVSRVKLQVTGTANRRISNIEPQNVEVWFRFAQSF